MNQQNPALQAFLFHLIAGLNAYAMTMDRPAGPVLNTTPPEGLIHRRLWEVATGTPTPGKKLAKEAGYKTMYSAIYQALTDLVRSQHLIRTADGYYR